MWIEPKGFEEIHSRGNVEAHRLQDPSKWVPFGVGAIEGRARASREGLRPRRGAAPTRRGAHRLCPRRAALGIVRRVILRAVPRPLSQ